MERAGERGPGDDLFGRIGRSCCKHPWWVIAAWLVVALAALPGMLDVSHALEVGGFTTSQLEAERVNRTLERELQVPPTTLVVTFHSDRLTATSPEFISQVRRALADVARLPYVSGISYHTYSSAQISRDRHTAYELIGLNVSPEKSLGLLPEIERRLRPTSLEMVLGGGPVFDSDVERTSERDLRRAEMIAFPIGLAALLIVFGSVVAAATPIVIGGFSVAVVLGLLALVARLTDMSIFTMNVATMLGLGLAVDYSLFISSRYREELGSRSVEDAVAAAASTAGRAVFFSGVTVLIGIFGLISFGFMVLRSVGIAGAIVVGVSVIAALTLLPAILGLVGHRINSLRVRLPLTRDRPFWGPLSRWVMRHPVAVLLPTLSVLLLLGVPFRNVHLSSPDPTILPKDAPSRVSYEQIIHDFPTGSSLPILVVVRSPDDITSPENLRVLYALSRAAMREPGVTSVQGIVNIDPRITLDQYELLYRDPRHVPDRYAQAVLSATTSRHITLMQVDTSYAWNDVRAQRIVQKLRNTRLPNGLEISVGGAAAEVLDVVSAMYTQFPIALLVVVLATYVVLAVMLRSVVLPLKAIVMNALSLLASYGALVWVFQEGHLSGLLGFQPLGYVETTLPILMFCTLFGLSMDYEVFLLSRVREEWERTRDNTASVAAGLERSGRIITSAALIVVVVALSFTTAQIVLVKALGLGVALAVFLDATLVRALLVPATMRLIGDWNWWAPAWLRRKPKPERSEAAYGG